MMRPLFVCVALLSIGSLACGGTTPPANAGGDAPAASGAAPAGAGDTLDAQIAQGKSLYAESCATCHGVSGEGKNAPPLMSKVALPLDPPPGAKQRKSQFKTAADVFAFTKAAMPPKAGGSLKDAEYWAILAFNLKTNGVELGGKKLDDASAAAVSLR